METILPYLGVEAIYTSEEEAKLAQTVGSYRSWSVRKAVESIEKAGLSYEIIGVASEDALVKAQSPAGGSYVQKGTGKIILYVGDAAPEETVVMPDLVGKNATLANGLLTQYKLNVKIEGARGADSEVYAQSIAPGTKVKPGTVVTLKFRSMVADDDLE